MYLGQGVRSGLLRAPCLFTFVSHFCEPRRTSLVARDAGVDDRRPVVDAACERLDVLEALLAKPHGDVERASAVMAEDDDRLIGVKLLMRASGHVAHGDERGARKRRGGGLPRLTNIQNQGLFGLFELSGEGVGGDFGRERHDHRIPAAHPKTGAGR